MKIADFIRDEILLRRLQAHEVLVVYDTAGRYRELCLSLATENDAAPEADLTGLPDLSGLTVRRAVVDASDSSILAREAMLDALQKIGRKELHQLLVYVPAAETTEPEQKVHDPFALAAVCGAVFPDAKQDGDQFEQICLRARPEFTAEIREIFARDPHPSFAVIDNIGGGNNYPQLQELLRAESARGLLQALLHPTDAQQEKLAESKTWVGEARQLVKDTLGVNLKTRGETWPTIANELWQLLLFSEFVFDLPTELPAALRDVACASTDRRTLVEDVCDRLRDSQRSQPTYIERAETLERELNLPAHCANLNDLGQRDTFPFEERTFMHQAIAALAAGDLERVQAILASRQQSVWSNRGEHQAQWQLVRLVLDLVETCTALEAEMAEQTQSQADLIAFYTRSVREADYLQREMERQTATLFVDELRPVVANGRAVYRAFTNRLQTAFVRHLEQTGWPPPAYPPTTQLFDRFVRPKLAASGQRVALLLIDALRYELGVELEKRLSKLGQSEIGAACAPLPTVTPLGMAALLPDANNKLSLLHKQNRMVVQYEDQPLGSVGQRIGVLNRLYGERVADVKLSDLARGIADIPATADLLLVRSNDMDQAFESNPDTGFAQIRTTLSQVLQAVKRLAELGFHDVVILTDHGFALNPDVAAGDVGEKPSGNWVNVHERLLLGDGTADNNNWVLPAEMLGIRGEFNQAAGPRALVAYRAGETYLHGGASLPEAIVPYLLLTLKTADSQADERPTTTISYKRKRITTQRPVIEVAIGPASSLFGVSNEIELLIEAHDAQGKVVGQVQGGDGFDEMTGTVRLRPGATGKITLGMSRTFEGAFTVKALDPTLLTAYDTLSLQTDYMVL